MKKLFSEFPDITTEEWKEKIRADLKDRDAIQRLTQMSEEGIEVKPFYRKEDVEPMAYLQQVKNLKKSGDASNDWSICQDIFTGKDLDITRQHINEAVKGGAEAIRLHFPFNANDSIQSLNTLLGDLSFSDTQILLQGNMRADAIYQLLTELASKKGGSRSDLRGCLGADPIGFMVNTGFPLASMDNLAQLVKEASQQSPTLRVINICGASIQNAGSTLVEELAFSLAIASDYLSALASKGLDPRMVQDALQLNMAVGPDFFMEIAKLRAARILWGSLASAYGVDPSRATVTIHSTSSSWNMTLYDPHVNMLRGTTEAIASILGGTDLLSVLPFDYRYGESSSFSDRIARNVQLILQEEAYLNRVADPASGSYFIENLTNSICDKSWELFREVETMGGFRKAFEVGWIQERVNRSKRKKLEKFSTGEGILVGTNAFPDFNEVLLKQALAQDNHSGQQTSFEPLLPFQPSGPFEKVRMATRNSKKNPSVFLFKYGPPAMAQARASFSGNFFACAGYNILDPSHITSIKEGINMAKETKAEIVVLCSTDDLYEELAAEVCHNADDRSLVVIAGYPAQKMEKLKALGIEHFIHRKSNLLEKLEEFNSILL